MTGCWLLSHSNFKWSSHLKNKFWMQEVGDIVSYAVTVSSLQNLKDSSILVAPNTYCIFTLFASVARTCSPAFWQDDKNATQLHDHLSISAQVRQWMFPLLMSGHKPWTLEHDLECCMSCLDIPENQNPQCSKSSNWHVTSPWHFIKHDTTVMMIIRQLLHWMPECTRYMCTMCYCIYYITYEARIAQMV